MTVGVLNGPQLPRSRAASAAPPQSKNKFLIFITLLEYFCVF